MTMWSRVISIAVSLCLVLAPLSITLDQNSIAQPVTIKIESAEAAIFVPLLAGAVVLGGIGSYFSNTVQGWVDTFAAFIGSLFIYFAAAVLGIAGSAFDFAIGAFASNLTGTLEFWGILEAIRRIWVVFRDLSQIVLIGFFIFIAINIILNNHEYSIKQHAVRAILVALFMNFSLFFSMAVIDVSNFVAYQFYRGIAGVGGASTISNPLGTQANVSGRIITSFGITQLNSWGGMIDELKKNNAGSGTKIVVSSIGIAAMFLIAAFAFLYCAWLLTRRAVLLILIMVTSSLATAALIIPKFQSYFDQWKTALLANAFFAPLLLLMLWTVIQIMDAMAAAKMPGLRPESFIEETAIQAAGSAMGRYAVMVVLFVVAIKIADTLAKKGSEVFGVNVGGAGIGSMLGGALAATPFGALQGRLRSSAAKRYQSGMDTIDKDMKDAAKRGDMKGITDLQKKRENLQKRIDAGGTMAGSNIDKILSKINKAVTGKDTKSAKVSDIIKKNATEKKKKNDNEEAAAKLLEPFARQQLKEKEGAHAAAQEEQIAKNYQEATSKLTEEIKNLKEGISEKQQTFKVQESDLSKLRDQVDADAKKVSTAAPGTISDPERREMDQRRGELTSKSAQIAELKRQIDADNDKIASQSASIAKLNETGGPEAIAKRKKERETSLREEQARTKNEQQRADRALDVVKGLGFSGDSATFLQQRIVKSASDVAREDQYKNVAAQLTQIQESANKPAAPAPAPSGAAPMAPKAEEKH